MAESVNTSNEDPNEEQLKTIGYINDRWPVATWEVLEDSSVKVILDDGDTAKIDINGNWLWSN